MTAVRLPAHHYAANWTIAIECSVAKTNELNGHLDIEEIYEILISLLLRVATQYDPDYSQKIAKIVNVINEQQQFESATLFTAGEIGRHLDFDCDRDCRMLCRRGFLVEAGKEEGRGLRYAKSGIWPPPNSFFTAGPVGFTYYLSKWFRYTLQQHISNAMSNLESKQGIYSLEGYLETRCRLHRPAHNENLSLYDPGRPDDSIRSLAPAHRSIVITPGGTNLGNLFLCGKPKLVEIIGGDLRQFVEMYE